MFYLRFFQKDISSESLFWTFLFNWYSPHISLKNHCKAQSNMKKREEKDIGKKKDAYSGVYSSNNWSPLNGGQNSILNWVLKLNPLNQNNKK